MNHTLHNTHVYGTVIVVWNISLWRFYISPMIDETMLNRKQIMLYCNTTAQLLGSINHPTVSHAKCPPWKWWAHLCTLSVRRWRKRAVLRGTGALPSRGGAQTKQHERRLQAETLRANTAQAALSKRRPPPRTSTHRLDRAMAAEPCSQIEAGGQHLFPPRLYRWEDFKTLF